MRNVLLAALIFYMLGGPFFQPMGVWGVDYVLSSYHGALNAIVWSVTRKPIQRTKQLAQQAEDIDLLPVGRQPASDEAFRRSFDY